MRRTGRRARAAATLTSQRRTIQSAFCRKAVGGSEEVTPAFCSRAAGVGCMRRRRALTLPPTRLPNCLLYTSPSPRDA
eukprot:2422379-Lingulodinium_polyedra.AAC.1